MGGGGEDIWDTNKKEEKRQSICQVCNLKPNPNVLKKKKEQDWRWLVYQVVVWLTQEGTCFGVHTMWEGRCIYLTHNKIIIGIFLLQEKNVSFEFVLVGMYRFL